MEVWPPSYQLRYSKRVKGVKLQICKYKGLEIVAPKKFKAEEIPSLLEIHRRWIERNLAALPEITAEKAFPKELDLLACHEKWTIEYHFEDKKTIRLKEKESYNLILSGATTNEILVRKVLLKWLCKKGKQHLLPWLYDLSQLTKLNYEQANVRYAKTRWGSCNAKKMISLNVKLLLLPPELAEYVMIHELCHLKYLNHSARFWNLVLTHNPEYLTLRKRLRADVYDSMGWL